MRPVDDRRVFLALHFRLVFRFTLALAAWESIDHIRSHIGSCGAHGRHESCFDQLDVDGVTAIAPIFFNQTRKTFRAIFRAEVVEHIATPKPAEIAAITRTAPRSPFLANAGVPSAALVDWRSFRLRPLLHPPGPSRRLNGHFQKLKCNPNNSGAEFENLGPYFAAFRSPVGFAAQEWLSGAPGFRTPWWYFGTASLPFKAFA
jgi:hypothetical protein